MLEKMLAIQNSSTRIFVIYDIACSLSKYLKVRELVTFHRFFKYSFCIRMLGEMIFFKKYRCAY